VSAIKEELHAVVDGMTDDEANRLLEVARELCAADEQVGVLATLGAIPGVALPGHWPPRFSHVEPITAEGKPASEMLIEDRQ